jgi:hypothetical protein
MKNEFKIQFETDQQEWKNIIQEFQNSSGNDDSQKEVVSLRFLFLQHLSNYHNIPKEQNQIDFFQNLDNNFEIFFNSEQE